jgi:hypothetical protein
MPSPRRWPLLLIPHVCTVLGCLFFLGGTPQLSWRKALSAEVTGATPPAALLQEGKTTEALEAFTRSPLESATEHLQAGLLAAKSQQLGRAHAHLSLARSRAPGNEEVEAVAAAIEKQARTLFGVSRLNAWESDPLSFFGTRESALLSVLLSLIALSFGVPLFLRKPGLLGLSPRASGVLFGCLLALLAVERGLSTWVIRQATPAVALDTLVGRTGPGSQYPERARVEAGARVLARPSSRRDGWMLARTPQQTLAWFEASKVGLLFNLP